MRISAANNLTNFFINEEDEMEQESDEDDDQLI